MPCIASIAENRFMSGCEYINEMWSCFAKCPLHPFIASCFCSCFSTAGRSLIIIKTGRHFEVTPCLNLKAFQMQKIVSPPALKRILKSGISYSLLSFVRIEYPIRSPLSLKDSDLIMPPPIDIYSTVESFVVIKPVLD